MQPKRLQFTLAQLPTHGGCRRDLEAAALKRKKPPRSTRPAGREGKEQAEPELREQTGALPSRSRGRAALPPTPAGLTEGTRLPTEGTTSSPTRERDAGSAAGWGSCVRAVSRLCPGRVPAVSPPCPRRPAPEPRTHLALAPNMLRARPARAATTCGSPATTSAPRGRAPLSHISGQSARGARQAPPPPPRCPRGRGFETRPGRAGAVTAPTPRLRQHHLGHIPLSAHT